jgi:DNA-directed RNA polymerase specialized sigma24 family protein
MVIPAVCRSRPVSSGPYVETGNERDRALICAIASGDRAAFEEIHSRYSGRIRAFALKRTRRRDLAEELTCETLTTWYNDELCEWLDAALALLPEKQRTAQSDRLCASLNFYYPS